MSDNYIRYVKSRSGRVSALLFLFFLSTTIYCQGQNLSFGPTVGTYFPWNYGGSKVDDVVVEIVSDQGDGERMVGGFVGYQILDYLSVKADLNYFSSSASFVVYNEAEECVFCPVMKGTLVSRNTLEFFPSVNYRIPLFQKEFGIGIVAGPSVHFQFRSDMPDVDFRGMHPGVSEVINAMEETPKAAVLYLNYGLSFEYRRLSLVARLQESPSSSFLNDLKVGERLHPFRFKTRYLNLTLSYKFYSLRKRQERALSFLSCQS